MYHLGVDVDKYALPRAQNGIPHFKTRRSSWCDVSYASPLDQSRENEPHPKAHKTPLQVTSMQKTWLSMCTTVSTCTTLDLSLQQRQQHYSMYQEVWWAQKIHGAAAAPTQIEQNIRAGVLLTDTNLRSINPGPSCALVRRKIKTEEGRLRFSKQTKSAFAKDSRLLFFVLKHCFSPNNGAIAFSIGWSRLVRTYRKGQPYC